MTLPRRTKQLVLAAALLYGGLAHALEFRSVLETGTVFQAGPAAGSGKLFVVSQFYPVEVVDENNGWCRVRDVTGLLAWVPATKLSNRRYVLVTAARTVLRQAPQDTAAPLLTAGRNVVLELLQPPSSLWVHVRHDGKTSAYVRVQDIWGI